MKRILIGLSLLLLLVGCGDVADEDKYSSGITLDNRFIVNKTEVEGDITIVEAEGDIHVICNDDLLFTLDSDVLKEIHPIKTNKEAVSVARAVLEKERARCNAIGKDFDQLSFRIVHFSKNNLWCFEYASEDVIRGEVDGGGWCIAIDGDSGRLISAWMEE